ncbi:MAG: OadG family protein [Spongiibacteraceae bacterium]|nr:OadG family protein [Spongiibacteraceae bacterium]
MQQTLWQQGAELMLYGMGSVFVFLVILIVVTTIMSSLLQRFIKPAPELESQGGVIQTGGNDNQLIAVISAAIHKYRSRHK